MWKLCQFVPGGVFPPARHIIPQVSQSMVKFKLKSQFKFYKFKMKFSGKHIRRKIWGVWNRTLLFWFKHNRKLLAKGDLILSKCLSNLSVRFFPSDGEVVHWVGVVGVREPLVADFSLRATNGTHLEHGTADGHQPRLPEPLHGSQVDLPQPQARTNTPDLLLTYT